MQNDKILDRKNPFKINRDGMSYMSGKFVGGYVPLRVAEHVQLLALYNGDTIQKTLERMIEEWCSEKETIPCILETLADKAYIEWKRRMSMIPFDIYRAKKQEFQEAYLIEIEDELKKKKMINREHIREISTKVRDRFKMENI